MNIEHCEYAQKSIGLLHWRCYWDASASYLNPPLSSLSVFCSTLTFVDTLWQGISLRRGGHVVAEYLSSVEDYLQNCLSNETLSTAAQIRRRHLIDKFYALRIPPNVTRKSAVGTQW